MNKVHLHNNSILLRPSAALKRVAWMHCQLDKALPPEQCPAESVQQNRVAATVLAVDMDTEQTGEKKKRERSGASCSHSELNSGALSAGGTHCVAVCYGD